MTYLWKYMSLDKFEKLLENKGLYFSSAKQLRENLDPMEGAVVDSLNQVVDKLIMPIIPMFLDGKEKLDGVESFYNNRQNDQTGILNGFGEIYDKLREGTNAVIKIPETIKQICSNCITKMFICSMHCNDSENYALWKIYPTDLKGELQINQGIAVRINAQYIKNSMSNVFSSLNKNKVSEFNFDIEDVQYTFPDTLPEDSNLALDEINKIKGEKPQKYFHLLYKTKYYEYENEKRLIIDFSESHKDIDLGQGGYLHFNNMGDFFNPENVLVYVSPFASESFKKYVIYLLEQKGLDGKKLVKQSSIKTT